MTFIEERLKLFDETYRISLQGCYIEKNWAGDLIRSFLKNALEAQEKRFKEKVEKLRKKVTIDKEPLKGGGIFGWGIGHISPMDASYNQALQDILDLLTPNEV